MPGVVSFGPTLMFYLLAIRFYVSAINDHKMLLTSLKKIIIQGSPAWTNQQALPHNGYLDGGLTHAANASFLSEMSLSPSQEQLPLECPGLTLSILPILVACDGVHTVACGAVGGWTVGLGRGQTVS